MILPSPICVGIGDALEPHCYREAWPRVRALERERSTLVGPVAPSLRKQQSPEKQADTEEKDARH